MKSFSFNKRQFSSTFLHRAPRHVTVENLTVNKAADFSDDVGKIRVALEDRNLLSENKLERIDELYNIGKEATDSCNAYNNALDPADPDYYTTYNNYVAFSLQEVLSCDKQILDIMQETDSNPVASAGLREMSFLAQDLAEKLGQAAERQEAASTRIDLKNRVVPELVLVSNSGTGPDNVEPASSTEPSEPTTSSGSTESEPRVFVHPGEAGSPLGANSSQGFTDIVLDFFNNLP